VGDRRVSPRIKYQEDLDLEFGKSISSRPGGEDLYRCIQCGTCSATCPVSIYMPQTPRRIIAMTRAGMRNEVLSSSTIWLCASCYACTVDCPKEIKITDIMYALKQEAMEQKLHPKRFPIPVLAREFFNSVKNTGRSNEALIIVWTFLKTDPRKLLGNAMMGLKLMLRGRMGMKEETMQSGRGRLKPLLDYVDRVGPEATRVEPQPMGH